MEAHKLIWLAICILFGMVGLKYIYWRIGRGMEELQRAAEDPEFRRQKLAELEKYLEANPADLDARLRRADLWRREGDYAKAASDLRLYLEHKAEDSEGWAELAECAIHLLDKHEALTAAQKALALDRNYSDYSALCLRANLLAGNLEAAQADWERWAELDKLRLARPVPERSWFSPLRQLPPGELVEDPGLAVYGAALLLRHGEREKARARLQPVREENSGYLELVLAQDPLIKDLGDLR